MKKTKQPVLADHHQEGKTFVPPFIHKLGKIKEVQYIDRIIPEIVWIQYLIHRWDDRRGIQLALGFLKACSGARSWEKPPEFSFLSAMGTLGEREWHAVRQQLQSANLLADLETAFAPFVRCYPQSNPLSCICPNPGTVEALDVEVSRTVVGSLFDRRSKQASVAQSVISYREIESGRLKFTANVPFPDLNSIFTDFEGEASMRACAHVRMAVNSLFIFHEDDIGETWAAYFWNRGKELTPLAVEMDIPATPIPGQSPFDSFAAEYESLIRSYVAQLWRKLPVDIYKEEEYAVVGALLGRQCNLAATIVGAPGAWDNYAGPLFLRALVDNYITTAWILKNPIERARRFISYGLGQEKLLLEHYKSEMQSLEPDEKTRMQQMIDAREAWINAQHYGFLQTVDVGGWSGIDTRKMAAEAGCSDLYRFAYTPWSQAAHGIWNHVSRLDAKKSADPLIKHLLQPAYFPHQDFEVLVNATKYLDKLFRLLDGHYQVDVSIDLPYDWLIKRAPSLFEEVSQMKAQQAPTCSPQTQAPTQQQP